MDEPPLKPSGKNYGLSLFMSYAVHIPRGIDGLYSRLLFFYIYIRIERSWDEWALGHTATSRKVVGKKVHYTIPKGNMGYDQYTVPDTVAVEPTFVAFL